MSGSDVPGAGLAARLATWSWVAVTEVGRAAFVFLAQPPPHAPDTERELLGLVRALGYRDEPCRMCYLGRRVQLWEASHAVVRLDGCAFDLRVDVGEEWARFVRGGGPVVVAVGLDPILACAEASAVDTYLREGVMSDRIRQGNTHT